MGFIFPGGSDHINWDKYTLAGLFFPFPIKVPSLPVVLNLPVYIAAANIF
jgi:hypothetical protein